MPITPVDTDEAEQADYLVCSRLTDLQPIHTLPIDMQAAAIRMRARSHRENCSGCNASIIVDSISPKRPTRVCIDCAKIIMETEGKTRQ